MKTSISKAFPPKRRLSVSSTPDVATRISPTSQPLLPPELIEANIDKINQRIENMKIQMEDKEGYKEVALGTSKIVSHFSSVSHVLG